MSKKLVWLIICVFVSAALSSCSRLYGSNNDSSHADSSVSQASSDNNASENTDDLFDDKNNAFCIVNKNVPFFYDSELTAEPYQHYSELDSLGRCGAATAVIGKETLPAEERGKIGNIKPSGWHTVKYNELIDGNYLYNRCHLIGYQLSGENANVCNLITGTRFLNVSGMLPFENKVVDHISKTGFHVLYRVTPKFEKDNLLADGVLIEAKSVEDNGAGLQFCVFCYNIQPGITIDYRTGNSKIYDGTPITTTEETSSAPDESSSADVSVTEEIAFAAESVHEEIEDSSSPDDSEQLEYIVNIGTKRFHLPDCPSVAEIKEKNKRSYLGTKAELEENGYVPCGRCMP